MQTNQIEFLPITTPRPHVIGESYNFAIVNRIDGQTKVLDATSDALVAFDAARMMVAAYGHAADMLTLAGRVRWHDRFYLDEDAEPLCVIYENNRSLLDFPELEPGKEITVCLSEDANSQLTRSIRNEKGDATSLLRFQLGIPVVVTAEQLDVLRGDWNAFSVHASNSCRRVNVEVIG